MVDDILMVFTCISSIAALYFSLRKQKHDEAKIDAESANLDADTIKTLYSLIDENDKRHRAYKVEQDACYAQLQKDFNQYKKTMNSQLADVTNENIKLRKWAKQLARQLEAAGILPTPFEL